MRPTEKIEKFLKNASISSNPNVNKIVYNELADEMEITKQTGTSLNLGRIIMKSPITKLAVAAAVFIACLIGLSLWKATGSGVALADVLAEIEKVNGYQCQWDYSETYTCKEDPNKSFDFVQRVIVLISSEYGRKQTTEEFDSNGGWSKAAESYLSPQKKTSISISHKNKKFTREELGDDFLKRQLEMPSFGLRSYSGPSDLIKTFLDYKYESTGRETIDGIEVEGFRITDPNLLGIPNMANLLGTRKNTRKDIKLWVDVKTLLPAKWQVDLIQEDSMSNEDRSRMVAHDFRWGVSVSPSEFEPIIPDDYTGIVVKWPSFNEEIAILGLKLWVELLGNYPASFMDMIRMRDFTPVRSAVENSQTPAALRLKEDLKGLTEDEKDKRLRDALLPIQCLTRFRVRLLWDKKYPAYYGKTVTPKDADKVLLRWKVSDNEYRVIFGDLHAETVTTEKLTELENKIPK